MVFPLHLLFLFSLVLGSIVAMNSSSWIVAWIGLEMNLMSILPVMASDSTKGSSESCMKYFLVQSMASLLILISSVLVFSVVLLKSSFLIFIGLSIKLGVAPFHIWFPIVMEGVGWVNCLLLMTWQSIAPLFLVGFVNIMIVMVIVTSVVGAIGGFGQYSLSSMIAYSSVSHVGWMLAGMLKSFSVGLVYYFMYFFLSILVVVGFIVGSVVHMAQVWETSMVFSILVLFSFLSLGGMPPTVGFFPKMFVIEKLFWSSLVLAIFLIFSSLVSLYFYIRVVYPSLFLCSNVLEVGLGDFLRFVIFVLLFFLSSGGFFFYPLLSSFEFIG